MFLHEIVVLQIVFVSVFDSFEGVVVGVEVVAGPDEGGVGEVDLLVEVLFEEEFQHLKKYYQRHDDCSFVQNQNKQLIRMNTNHQELSEHAHVVMPSSSVRTISLQKFRQPSPLAQRQNNSQQSSNRKVEERDSKKMYEKLISKKLDRNMNNENKPINGRQIMSKKFQELKKQVDSKQMKECTFKPQVNPTDRNPRSVNQFFNDQIHHNQKKNDKVQEMRILLENNKQKQNIFRPNAMLNREQKSSGEDKEAVYQRLYQDSRNKDKNSQLSRQDSREITQNQSISSQKRFKGISRGNSSGQLRKNSSRKISVASQELKRGSLATEHENISAQFSAITDRKISTELSKEMPKRKQSKPSKRVDVNILEKRDNSRNEEIVVGKLMKEISMVITRCNLPLVFSYSEMNLFLQKMNFISSQSNSRKQVYEMWNMLQGQIFQEVSSLSVMKVVYAIMGCHNVDIVNKCIQDTWLNNNFASQHEEQCKSKGKKLSFRQNLLMLSQRDSRTLKQCYEEMYLNRMKMGESQFMKDNRHFEYSFKPEISKTTAQYAEKYRNRMLNETQKLLAENKISYQVPESGQIDHVDLLMLDERRKSALLAEKRQEHEREKRRQEDESICNPNSERDSNRSSRNVQKDRNQELFEMGKHINQMKKDKSADEVDEEKWKNELTFKPAIKSKKTILQQLSSKQNYIPDYDKTVYRMQAARKNKETQSRPSNEKDDSPLLYLNVVMEGNEGVKVPVFRNDNMATITQKVRNMMSLTSREDSGRLQNILKMQILPALQEMELSGVMS